MYHSLIFFEDFEGISTTSELDGNITYTGTKLKNPINTWDDWHLVPTSRPVINPPNPRTSEVIIPGRSGSLDLSEVLTGYPLFDNRTGSIEFIVMNDYWDWSVAYSTIMRHLHGKTFKMMFEDDPAYYYEGRFSVNNWKSDKNWSLITIDYNIQPYKAQRQNISEDWLWDSFCFETGVIYDKSDVTAEISSSLDLYVDYQATRETGYITSNHKLHYYSGDFVPIIDNVVKAFVIYAKDDHSIPSVTITGFDNNEFSIHLPCIVYDRGNSTSSGILYYICDALYTFTPKVLLTISMYNSISDYNNQDEPDEVYSIEVSENGIYENLLRAMPASGVTTIRAELIWNWSRKEATRQLTNVESYIEKYVYGEAQYEPADNPIWLSPENPFHNTYTDTNIFVQYTYPSYIVATVGESHALNTSATVSVDYRGGIL